MRKFLVVCLLLCTSCLFAGDKKVTRNFAQEDLKQDVADVKHQLHVLEVERGILEERLDSQEKLIQDLRQKLDTRSPSGAGDKRVGYLEKVQEGTLSDMQQLKKHAADCLKQVNDMKAQVDQLETHVDSNILHLKSVVETLVKALQKDGSSVPLVVNADTKTYKVKSGDSLEKIAKAHKTTIQALKNRNQLKQDRIIVGQELIIE
ncbi:MAG: LysM peptidoglycan-binding domain-containing protein [Parachlamydiales bacterium]|nr:LysM peptidoglycan-binding domain-containing protein [Parachlamydiales bacterium]